MGSEGDVRVVRVTVAQLDRMETTLADLSAAVREFAVLEERVSHHLVDMHKAWEAINNHDDRIRAVELVANSNSSTAHWLERIVWMVLCGIVAAGKWLP